MSALFWSWVVLGALVALVWLVRLVALGPVLRRRRVLRGPAVGETAGAADESGRPFPRLSVILAAKDEDAHIEACVTSLLAQDYPDFELIVVDDRSSDRTPGILARLAREHPGRLRVETVRALPDGWFGKCNAMREGVALSDGEWLVFTDADCRFASPHMLSLGVREALDAQVDFLTVIPNLEAPTAWEKILQPACSLVLIFWFQPERVNNPATTTAYANGAFMLMKRRCYDALGGHAAVKNQLNEDIQLARLAKAAGWRLRVVENEGLYSTRMYATLPQALRGWSRIFCGSLIRPLRVATAAILVAVCAVAPWASAPAAIAGFANASPDARGAWSIALAVWGSAIVLEQLVLPRLYATVGLRRRWSLLYVFGALTVVGILVNAWLKTLGATTTTWRATTYRAGRTVPPKEPPIEPQPAQLP